LGYLSAKLQTHPISALARLIKRALMEGGIDVDRRDAEDWMALDRYR
jgi:hypothetical protein